MPKVLTRDIPQPAASARDAAPAAGAGYYDDGAYVALPAPADEAHASFGSDSGDDDDIQAAYYRALKSRFVYLREQVAAAPPGAAATSQRHLPLGLQPAAKGAQWAYGLQISRPTLRDLRSATQDDITRGLTRLETLLKARAALDAVEGRNLGCWAWVLLAKCRDMGALHSEHIAVVRQLAKTALVVANQIARTRSSQPAAADSEDQGSDEAGEDEGHDGPRPPHAAPDPHDAAASASDGEG